MTKAKDPIKPELEQPLDISSIDHAEMVHTLAKSGAIIAVELTEQDINILNVLTHLCALAGKILLVTTESNSNPITEDEAHNWHMAIGMFGEAGELLDAVKKSTVYRKELDLANVVEELGDFEFYFEGFKQKATFIAYNSAVEMRLAELYELFDITREEVIEGNIRKLAKRYNGLKYSDQAAQDRADKA